MTDDDLLDDAAAADAAGVSPDRIEALVAEGLLTPVGDDPRRFRRAEAEALRHLGG